MVATSGSNTTSKFAASIRYFTCVDQSGEADFPVVAYCYTYTNAGSPFRTSLYFRRIGVGLTEFGEKNYQISHQMDARLKAPG